jgi:L-lactate dehydrogenase complex protein LldG
LCSPCAVLKTPWKGEDKLRPYEMKASTSNPVLDKVRRALGRSAAPLSAPPTPPEIDEHVVRLVYSAIGLSELFMKRAADMKMVVEAVRIDELMMRVATFLKEQGCQAIMLSDTPLLKELRAAESLKQRNFQAAWWSQMTADEAYEYDAGVTEVDYGVAETGSLVVRHRPEHGRLLSLVPFVHVAVVEPKVLVPDLIDLFAALKRDGTGSGITMITGPSKTADIEMHTVTGVHGPNIVKAFVLS